MDYYERCAVIDRNEHLRTDPPAYYEKTMCRCCKEVEISEEEIYCCDCLILGED